MQRANRPDALEGCHLVSRQLNRSIISGFYDDRSCVIARVEILEAEQRRERVLGGNLRLRVFGRPKSAA